MVIERSVEIGGRILKVVLGKIARQADGAAWVQYGDTVLLGTVVSSREPRPGVDFLPLTVDYREKFFAAGKIPGGFFKREGRPHEKEILSARLIDRPIRPLFPEGYNYETQI
ncbi:MAG: polyribonucleotide nucleotidyltransferase, partial [bacterium]